jgi:hypothetical protein
LNNISRFEVGVDTTAIIQRGKIVINEAFVNILEAIPEFSQTTSVVIELQLAFNRGVMSRLDGIAYGFLKGRFPSMDVSLNASTIRKRFIEEELEGIDTSNYMIPRGYPATKIPSILFVAVSYPPHYDYIRSNNDKIDDICDSIVYAGIALYSYIKKIRGK